MVRRIGSLTDEIQIAHELGFGPGQVDKPWTLRAQQSFIEIYRLSLPNAYLTDLTNGFRDAARQMARTPSPIGIEDEWFIISSYLRSAVTALAEQLEPTDRVDAETSKGLADTTPAVLRFDELARLYSTAGAARLGDAARSVLEARDVAANPLSEEERRWVSRLTNGDSIASLAADSNVSSRTLNRRLSELWRRLGAGDRVNGIALCNREAWVE